jgi:hypothetical protein
MGTFWYPLPARRASPILEMKAFSGATFALWARCDICFYSGPFREFSVLYRGSEEGVVCGKCGFLPNMHNLLFRAGWRTHPY